MSDGSRRLVVNTLERAVSNDINRMQSFKDRMISEIARYQFGVYERDLETHAGVVIQPMPGAGSPLTNHGIVNGLLVKPINGTVDLLIEPGLLFVEDSGYTAGDDSFWRYVSSEGVSTVGQLTLTPSPGATRVDVIECRYLDSVIEQDNRDIFNVATGLFTPTLIDKVRAGRLEFRIRLGTPGAGYPGAVFGWMPLCIAIVSNISTTWDTVTLYDVRALVSKFVSAPFASWSVDAQLDINHISSAWNSTHTQMLATGKARGRIGQYMIEGYLLNHPTNSPYFEVSNTNFWMDGMVAMADTHPWYIYSCFPHGLPFWRKYNGVPNSPRRPTGLPGVLVVSQVAPTARGMAAAPIVLPVASGLIGITYFAIPIASGMPASGSTATPLGQPAGTISDGSWTIMEEGDSAQINPAILGDETVGNVTSRYNLVDGLNYPSNANSLKLQITRSYIMPSITGTARTIYVTVQLTDPTTNQVIAILKNDESHVMSGRTGETYMSFSFVVDIPFFKMVDDGIGNTRRIEVIYNQYDMAGLGTNNISEFSIVRGWKLTE